MWSGPMGNVMRAGLWNTRPDGSKRADLPALLLNFGAMALVGLVCEKVVACKEEVACSR